MWHPWQTSQHKRRRPHKGSRDLKLSDLTKEIHDAGVMPPDVLRNILGVYFGGDMEAAPALAGQTVGLIHEVKPAKDIIDETVAQFHQITGRLGALAASGGF